MSCARFGRDRAAGLGVVARRPARSPSAATSSAGSATSPTSTSSPTTAPNRHSGSCGEQLALRRRPAPPARSRPPSPPAQRPRPRRRRPRGTHARRRAPRRHRRGHAGLVVGGQRLLQAAQRRAQLELAEDLAQLGAVGLAGGLVGRVDVDGDVAHDRRQLLGDARVVGVVDEVLLALGAGDLVDRGQHRLEVVELLQQRHGGLVADAGNAGDVVRRVALEAVEVGDQLRRDAVAVDDRLVVIQLGVGDPAARRHHAHARLGVDQLEDVAIAGDDHDRDAPPRAFSAIEAMTSSAS